MACGSRWPSPARLPRRGLPRRAPRAIHAAGADKGERCSGRTHRVHEAQGLRHRKPGITHPSHPCRSTIRGPMLGKAWLLMVVVVAVGVAARAEPPPPPRAPATPPRAALSALKNFNLTLLRVRERYLDPGRMVPRAILSAVLDGVQREIPEMLVEPDGSPDRLAVTVGDKRMMF